MKRFWTFLRYFLAAKKRWRWPQGSDVLMYDAAGQEVLLEHLGQWRPEILHIRGEQINVPILLTSLRRSGRRFDAYVDAFIDCVRPKLIVTFTDNDPKFYSLAARHPGVRTLFIQNGSRSYDDVFGTLDQLRRLPLTLRVHRMMTFGSGIGAEYSKYISGEFVPMGSLKNNAVPRTHATKPGTIAYISQYRNLPAVAVSDRMVSRAEFYEQVDRVVLAFLLQYAKARHKALFIVPCAHLSSGREQPNERRYYNELLGQEMEFYRGTTPFASYDAVDSAEVVVGIDSTLTFESAARGNKTAFFAIRGHFLDLPHVKFGWPEHRSDEGPFWSSRPDPAAFERVMDHLFAMSDAQWQSELRDQGFDNVIVYDPGNAILRSTAQQELGSHPVPEQQLRAVTETPSSAMP
jgi:surface carbohydrate biosynthesis protein